MARSGDEELLDRGRSHLTRDFHHPYTPYDIQETFMGTVYDILEGGNVGILESPTGTGKSLSFICGSLTWLRDFKGKAFEEGLNWIQDDSDEPAWVIEQAKARKRRGMLRQREEMEARLSKIRAKEKAQGDKYMKGEQSFKRRKVDSDKTENNNEEQFVLEDYESDQEHGSKSSNASGAFSAATLELMAKIGMGPPRPSNEEEEVEDEIKIFYCSRTHSQLSQFISELRRPSFPSSIKDISPKGSPATNSPVTEPLKHLTLGSRKNLCIHPTISKLSSLTTINERCSELQQISTPKDKKCQFIPNTENQPLVNSFRDHVLATIQDIEDLGSLGKQIGICPYYATRSAIRPAEIVTLPYPLLLQKSAREALGINLKGHVVIIDEAHNLMDAISAIHGVEISMRMLKKGRAQLGIYLGKFKNKLKGKNRVYIAQVIRVIDSLVAYLEAKVLQPKADGIVSEKEMLAGKGVDQINLFKLIHYLSESKLARKVEGYALHTAIEEAKTSNGAQKSKTASAASEAETTSTTPVLHNISSLLQALTHPSKEGRLFYTKSTTSPDLITLRYQLLDPSTLFQEIVSSARAVLLAGGTMSPMTDYTTHLFPYLPPGKITTLSCPHVIPSTSLLATPLSKGPTGIPLTFTYTNRSNTAMIDELGFAILNLISVIPHGVVVFFPSYNYLDTILVRWSLVTKEGQKSIIQRLEAKKTLHQESSTLSSDDVLSGYTQSIAQKKGGALLFAVVGGKMSEGINFSDDLGRGVIIVGLPFPNINSSEWKAKMEYIEASTIERGGDEKKGKEASREFYENACMRAVNQSVGRAIRHKGDYAAIIMIDSRYEGERIQKNLPGWIREGLVIGEQKGGFGGLMGKLGGFFRGKKVIAK